MAAISDHPLRYDLANELHARPFPLVDAPGRAVYLAIKRPTDAAARDRDEDRAHLVALLDHFGADHPKPGATHYFCDLGRVRLKWESHTEFVTYTLFASGVAETPFDASLFGEFPADWLEDAPGERVTSALIRVETGVAKTKINKALKSWFVPESVAAARVLDGKGVMAGDFRIDAAGHMRFAVFVEADTGPSRVGRTVQRLCEIETYKAMSMLGLARSREIAPLMAGFDQRLTGLAQEMTQPDLPSEGRLSELLLVSSELESLRARAAFRFGATGAYEALVHQRIAVMGEERFEGRQTFREFMMRRFDPAMRTVKSTEENLEQMAERATRAANLLRARVDVDRAAQNQKLLESMDRRAALQLRLQHTVEGLSVVAISYYAVNLVLYLLGPLAYQIGLDKPWLAALVTPVVGLLVWGMIRRIRKGVE